MRTLRSGRRLSLGGSGARCAVPACVPFVIALAVAAAPRQAVAGDGYADRTAVLLGAGGGIAFIDLPDVNDPGRTFGSGGRMQFEIGGEVRPWLEIGADLAFTALGESDSLNAILASWGSSETSAVTHVQSGVVVRARWLGARRWAPFARVGAGVAGLWMSAPGGLGGHVLDPAWSAGGGLELDAHRLVVLRAEGQYAGQAADGGVRSHAAATLSVLLAIPRSVFD